MCDAQYNIKTKVLYIQLIQTIQANSSLRQVNLLEFYLPIIA